VNTRRFALVSLLLATGLGLSACSTHSPQGSTDAAVKDDTSSLWLHGGVLVAEVALLAAAVTTLVVLWRRSTGGLTWVTVAIGMLGAMFGVVAGFIVGFFVGASFGSAWIPGVPEDEYLQAAPVLAVPGGVVFGVLAFWLALRRRSVPKGVGA
jgi:uncharacterized protein YacL